jgi:anaerobic carbon-monoxide dehydrogenase iron sulfur subunit
MCAMVCPFDAVSFHLQLDGVDLRSAAMKCDGCIDRVRAGQEPACSEVCKVDALVFGELNEIVNRAREKGAAVVLSAVAMAEPEAVSVPEHVKAWRAWGRSADAAKAQA